MIGKVLTRSTPCGVRRININITINMIINITITITITIEITITITITIATTIPITIMVLVVSGGGAPRSRQVTLQWRRFIYNTAV